MAFDELETELDESLKTILRPQWSGTVPVLLTKSLYSLSLFLGHSLLMSPTYLKELPQKIKESRQKVEEMEEVVEGILIKKNSSLTTKIKKTFLQEFIEKFEGMFPWYWYSNDVAITFFFLHMVRFSYIFNHLLVIPFWYPLHLNNDILFKKIILVFTI